MTETSGASSGVSPDPTAPTPPESDSNPSAESATPPEYTPPPAYPPPPEYPPPPAYQPPAPAYQPSGDYAPPPPTAAPPPAAYAPPAADMGAHAQPTGPGGTSNPFANFDAKSLQNFDPKTVKPLDWGVLGAGVLALLFSFFSWYHYSISELGFNHDYGGIGGGFTGFLVKVLILVGIAAVAIAVLAPQVVLPVPVRLIGVGAFGLATLFTLFKLLIRPRPCFLSICAPGHYSPSIGLYLTLIVLIVATALAFLRFVQTGGKLF
jgi:hypothetical protein